MASTPEVVFPVEIKKSIEAPREEKKGAVATDLELVSSEKEGEISATAEGDYTPEQYKKVLRKIGVSITKHMFMFMSKLRMLTTIRSIPPSLDVVLLWYSTNRQDFVRHSGHLRLANRHWTCWATVFMVDDHLLHHVPLWRISVQLSLTKMVARKILEHIYVLLG